MFLILDKNGLIIYKFDEQPKFRNGYLVFPIIALDISETNSVVVKAEPILFEFVYGAVSYVSSTYVITNQELYNEVITSKNKAMIPQTLTPRQIRMQLTNSGLRQQVEDIVANSSDYALKDWWEYSLDYKRDNEQLLAMASLLNISDTELDRMFIEASQL